MLSRNNFKEATKRDAQNVPHYGLRKLSVGVASVLLSTTICGAVIARADVTDTQTSTGASIAPAQIDDRETIKSNQSNLTLDSASPQPQSSQSTLTTNPNTSPTPASDSGVTTPQKSMPETQSAPVVKLAQVTSTASQPTQNQSDAFLKAGSVSPSGGMDSNEIIKEAQGLGLNAVTVSLLTDFGDLHGSNPTIAQADWDKMAANVTALQAKGYKVIIQLYPVINNLRDVETAWAPSNKDQFFRQYDQLLERTAKFAEQNHVYGMYMATNLIKTEQYEDDWETAIQKVRALYHGKIFFRTNWWYYADWAPDTVTNYNNMLNRKFWKDVDVISIAAYFELMDKPNPTSEDLQKALYDVPYNNRHQNIVAQIQALHDKWHKPIFFGELGLAPYATAPASPWDNTPAEHTRANDQVVANWFDAFYKVFSKYDWWKGYSIFTIDDAGSWYNPYGHSAATTIKNQSIEATAAYQAAQPKNQDVSATDPGAKTSVTRTINVTNPLTKQVTTVTQTVKFKRTATKDLSTKKVSYGNWQVDGNSQWATYTPPAVAGYTPTPATVAAVTPNASSGKQTVNVTYTANPQTATIKYVDDDKGGVQVGAVLTIKGPTGSKVATNIKAPTNYVLSGAHPAEYTFTDVANQQLIVHLKHGKQNINDQRQVVRTVNYTDPNTKQTKLVERQTATLHRIGTKDLVTNNINWNAWSTSQLKAVNAPKVAGYQVTNGNAAGALTVNDQSKDSTVTFTYTANNQTTHVKYVDKDNPSNVIHTTSISGKADQTVNVPSEVPTGWQLVSGLSVPKNVTFTDNGYPDTTVKIEHKHTTVTPDHPKTTNDKLPDNPAKNYPSGVGQHDLNKTITRTIQVTDPHTQKVATTTQTVHLTRTADVDEVSDAVTYGKWTTGTWDEFKAPAVTGYTPSQANVAKTTVTDTTKDQTVTITYTAQAQTQTTHVKYVDKNNPSNVIHTTDLSGKTGQTVNVPSEVPAGWQLVSGQQVPTSITFTNNGYPDTIVKIAHKHVTVTPDHPKTPNDKLPDNPTKSYPTGVDQNDLNKTTTRTINVVDPHTQKVTTTKQTVTLTRTADLDEITGAVKYSNWTTAKWDAYVLDSVDGYIPSVKQVDALPVTVMTKDETVTITYAANPQSVDILYVDHNHKENVIKTQTITGKTDQSVPVPNGTPTGWKLTPGQKIPEHISFSSQGHDNVVIEIEHAYVTVAPNHPKTKTDKLPDNPDQGYPSGVSQDDLSKTVTRTINAVDPHTQKVTTTKQTVELTRTADVDEVTKTVTYGKWTTGEWPAYTAPIVDGYTPNQANVTEVTVTDTTQDQTIKITYTANSQSMLINYVDKDGKIIHTTPIKGLTTQTVKVPNEVPTGWKLVTGQTVPSELIFDPNGHPVVTVKIEHHHVTITPDQPKMPNDKLPDNPTKSYPSGVSQGDLNKTVTRTINVVDPHTKKVTTTTQVAHLNRTADVDEVTGAVTYGKWTTGTWDAFTTPREAGYTPNIVKLDKVTVTDQTRSETLTIEYTANSQSTMVQLVNRRGKVVQTTKVNGHTDETVPVSVKVPNGWKLVTGEKLPTEIHFTADGHPIVQVTVEHGTVKVTPDHPYDDGTPLPDNPDLTFHGVDQAHLNKLVTRTINVKAPNGQVTTEKQTVYLTRSATVDEVTGAVTYEAWTTGEWQAYTVLSVPGYTPNQAKVDQQTVTSQTQDQVVNIDYTANAQSTTVTLVDPRGKEVGTDKIDGHTGETVPVPIKVPAGWQLVPGEELPTEITFGPDGHPAVTVKIEHRHVTATPDHPYADNTLLPDNPSLGFHGVSETDLNRTITRTIVVNVPGQAAKTIVQTAHLTRSATVDEVTGAVVYEPWTTAEWPEFDAPAIDGYEPDQAKLPNVKVMVTMKDQTFMVNYRQIVKVDPSEPTMSASPTFTSTSDSKQAMSPANHSSQQVALPQTGNKDNSIATLGLLVAGSAGLVLTKKKRQSKKILKS